ncbi:serine/threonine-protein kinase Nek3-like [Dendronephthya gigantea]|uniref:serine/threonine-protein kinase Nek3-like n=1 Tax=Dendronephthya gigantea TaxID=151771 RepID=UPI00106D8FB5|nr:serine/threonine-protein kinase Nek3-like [Dendronephthya gigantea]
MESYTKLCIIGTGSFGTVWLIRTKEKRRDYVLKEISLSLFEERKRGFILNEVKVLSQLRHMNIIRYKEAFLSNGFLCISMEYANGGDLSDRIQKQRGQLLPNEQIIDWFIQLCLALKYIHGLNILHRDIKCQNIFITKESVIKIGDFGIACVLQNTMDHACTIIGTPYYLSPEICQRQPYNHKSDMWALGCVLYEMITLRHPFESADFPQLVFKILHSEYNSISENRGPLLQDLVSVLLRVEPSERPSAKQILHIPAMQSYVNKVLARGRSQRSESVSCGDEQSSRKANVWRKPVVIPALGNKIEDHSRNLCHNEDPNHVEDYSKTCTVEPVLHVKEAVISDVACLDAAQSREKSSEVFFAHDNRGGTEAKKRKIWRGRGFVEEKTKENHKPQSDPSKSRSYSTSILRECAERSSLVPLNRHEVNLRGTYDIPAERNKPLFQGTYTKSSNSKAYNGSEVEETASQYRERKASLKKRREDILETERSNECPKVKKRSFETEVPHANSSNATSPGAQTTLLKVLLQGSHITLENISSESSLQEYVQAMRLHLEESLGWEVFNALHKYLRFDVEKDLVSGIDHISEKLFKALDEDKIVFLPLMLQYITCEKSLLAK